jgi:hypothetical protein
MDKDVPLAVALSAFAVIAMPINRLGWSEF